MPDDAVPLCSAAEFTQGAYADLASGYLDNGGAALGQVMLEATRLCEDMAGRRLAPFTVTESHAAQGINPDEYSDMASVPMSLQSTLNASYAAASGYGAGSLVRRIWIDERAPRYQDMWRYSGVSVTLLQSFGGTQQISQSQLLSGPDPDTGLVWFQLGLFSPLGSLFKVTYTAGYNPVPASLVRACKFQAAALIVRELNPDDSPHDPDVLEQAAEKIMERWQRA